MIVYRVTLFSTTARYCLENIEIMNGLDQYAELTLVEITHDRKPTIISQGTIFFGDGRHGGVHGPNMITT
jgi:hypothetical protein